MVLFTASFVMLTLLVNAPLLPMVLKLTGLNKVSRVGPPGRDPRPPRCCSYT
jgi:hypothetical protein